MDYALRTDTLAETVETKIKDLFLWVLVAKGSSVRAPILNIDRVVYLRVIVVQPHRTHVFPPSVLSDTGCCKFFQSLILLDATHLGGRYLSLKYFLELSDAALVDESSLVANLTNDALCIGVLTLAAAFLLSS